jgi:hypothetical protein
VLQWIVTTRLRYAKKESSLTNQLEQLQQKKLAEMITEITKAQFYLRLAFLEMKEKLQQLKSLWPKENNVDMAIILLVKPDKFLAEWELQANILSCVTDELRICITYEGTHDIHLLPPEMDIV